MKKILLFWCTQKTPLYILFLSNRRMVSQSVDSRVESLLFLSFKYKHELTIPMAAITYDPVFKSRPINEFTSGKSSNAVIFLYYVQTIIHCNLTLTREIIK